ncbi:MAG: tripartite tricarboxylate transporter TctB family protein [Spirochaetales bacterium]|jgi:putative tricarboxylic transport membrane protein|nr:tripartite tricarboxylate transporter TctB family protein [Spirochaetales bacterium]
MKLVKKWDVVICLVLSAALGVFIFELRGITPIARIYPAFVIFGSYIMIAIVIFQAFRAPKKAVSVAPSNPPLQKNALSRILVYCAAILAYILFIEPVGYILSTILFAVFSLLFLRNKNKIVLVTLPVVFALAMYFIFAWFLYVRLPGGELFSFFR